MSEKKRQKVYLETSLVSYLRDAGLKSPVIITPKRYMEDIAHDE